MSIFLPILFLIGISISGYIGAVPKVLMGIYLITSAVTFVIYAWDKAAARNKKRRTPEHTLHLLSLVGGWPGALVAQQTFRHKTIKRSFRWVFWLTVGINFVVVAVLLIQFYKQ